MVLRKQKEGAGTCRFSVDLQNGKTIRIPLIWYNNAQAVSKSEWVSDDSKVRIRGRSGYCELWVCGGISEQAGSVPCACVGVYQTGCICRGLTSPLEYSRENRGVAGAGRGDLGDCD